MVANVQTMMYVGKEPWHGLGTKLEKAATSEEAIIAAGLNWKVEKKELFTQLDGRRTGEDKYFIPVPGKYAIVREDTRQPLGVVGDVYKPLQNIEAFSFFDAIVGVKDAMYHTAGALGDGECVWILAKLPGYIRVVGDDVTEKYLLLTNRHDGGGSIKIFFTPIRVVCQNTLNIALRDTRDTKVRARVKHTATLGQRVNDIQNQLGIVSAQFSLLEDAGKALTKIQMTGDKFKEYIKATGLVPKDTDTDKPSTRAENIMDEVSALFERGKGAEMKGVHGTAWGAFNAVVEYVDYERTTRGLADAGSEQQARAKSLLFGSGAAVKQQAWDAAMEMVK